jgi:ribosomal protein L37E
MITYELGIKRRARDQYDTAPAAFIRCLICGRESFNPNDIDQKYCGYCHVFHGEVDAETLNALQKKGASHGD